MANGTKIQAIPDLVGLPPELVRVLEPIKQALEVRLGLIGDALDRAATLRDLQGFDQAVSDVTATVNKIQTSSGESENPGSIIPPSAITGLTAVGAMTNIILEWDANSSAYVEIWRADVDDLGLAVMIGTTTAIVASDPVDTNTTKYYWVRGVSAGGTPGPFNSATGTHGTTGFVMADDLADLLITADKLSAGAVDWMTHVNGEGKPADNATVGSTWGTDITNQPPDSTILNTLQQWAQISGSGRPQDNATVGATWGANIANQPSDNAVLNVFQQWAQVGGTGKPADNATVGANWNSNLFNKPADAQILNSLQQWSQILGTRNMINSSTATTLIESAAIVGALIAHATIGTAHIQNAAITNALIDAAAITSAKIANAAVGSAAIANLAVGTGHIQNAAIVNAKISNAAVDDAKIANLSAGKVTFGTMSGDRIAVNTLHGNRIIANTISGDRVIARTITADRIGTKALTAASGVIGDAAVDTLQLAGQAVTIPSTSYTELFSIHPQNVFGYKDIISMSIDSEGQPVIIFFSCRPNNGDVGGHGFNAFKIQRNGADIPGPPSVETDYTASYFTFNMLDASPGSGSNTYTVQGHPSAVNTTVYASYVSFSLIGAKR